MLERLDTLIAFATILLGFSLLVMIINQMIASLLGHRATYLKDGLIDLLVTLDPNLAQHAEKIADDVLTHKLASDSIFAHQSWAPQRWKLTTTVRSEELPKLLTLVSQAKPYAQNIQNILSEVNPTLKREAALINSIAPAALTAEQVLKELSNSTSRVIGRLEAGFNSTVDRVQQRFTLQMRIWTIVFSFILAFVYHMDAKKIYSQLSTDPQLRASVSNISGDLMKSYTEVAGATPNAGTANTPAQAGPEELKARTERLSDSYKHVKSKLSDFNLTLFDVPSPWYRWKQNEIFGMLVMTAFLSLGAPFWYNVVKNLVNLRSQVAQKRDEETAKSAG